MPNPELSSRFDVAVIGGSYAGLSAALQLARARRPIVVIDGGRRRNRFASHSHGFLGQDGRPPAEIAADGRGQLLAYPNVHWIDGSVADAQARGGGWQLQLDGSAPIHARRIVLAHGVVDELPELEGLRERWGQSIFHCPYCHGYELDGGPIGVLAVGPVSEHHALMLPDWGPTTLLTNGRFEPDAAQRAALAARGTAIEPARVRRISGTATVELEDGRALHFAGLFTAPRTRLPSPLAERLGCAIETSPMGEFIQTDAMKATSVPGIFACGDAARMAGSVALAVGDGAMAGAATHRSLMFP